MTAHFTRFYPVCKHALVDAHSTAEQPHPYDTAIAAYILAVAESHPDLLRKYITEKVNSIGLFWTRFALQKLDLLLKERDVSTLCSYSLPAKSAIIRLTFTKIGLMAWSMIP